ncbi:FMN-dependent L-lactate dehydrogenase LldD [Swingsia samuiensis]|uniref:Alpha-hydroxy-acid oxidizing protein n=1 Tax=Swingsia samuiensis TaxID=1293412 RepID=A0A4Y6UIC2_9PROT|nr:FMN-dependent L-lactate dehydrogenase LldD [Swingsia samuiensis]QDH16560.1 alpha-hydroxy-acid oxidizing protein [Swingsia samuiensis]
MIISSPTDYRTAAKRTLPRFLFDYIDGGAVTEKTMRANYDTLQNLHFKQRVLTGVGNPTLNTEILGQNWSLPFALAPVGATGLYARRGEVQAARSARRAGIPYTLSTVSVCPIEEVARKAGGNLWSQLYVLKDRGYMKNSLDRAWANGMKTLVFTVDMPTPGSRYRDRHSGMSGPIASLRQYLQALTHPRWALDVGLMGRPLSFGNIEAYKGQPMTMSDYMGFIGSNFDPSIRWQDLEWIRESWKGSLIIKGILDPEDAKDALRMGADGIIVSNHGGRQLDGAVSTTQALPAIVDAVGDRTTILADSGIRSGVDVARMIALGAKGVLLGRSYIYALAAQGEKGVSNLISLIAADLKVTMTLVGASTISDLTTSKLELL